MIRAMRTRRRRPGSALLLAPLPSLLTLAAAPVLAAAPAGRLIPICTGEGSRWIAIDDRASAPEGRREGGRREDGRHAACAHAACPRETGLARKKSRV